MNSMFKKFISAFLAAAFMASMSAVAFADVTELAETEQEVTEVTEAENSEAEEAKQEFTDMPDDWRKSAIENAVANGLISGMGDGTVAPDSNITRAQMAAIIVRALGAKNEADISMFADVSEDKWYYKELSKAVYMNAFSGDGENMNPENNITFQECFTVLSRVFSLDVFNENGQDTVTRITEDEAVKALELYEDSADVAAWAAPYYGSIVAGGYWSGGEEMLLRPTDYITRGEFAVVMDNLVKLYVSEPGEVTEIPEGNVVVRCDDAVLDGVTVNGDLIIADGVSAEKLTLKDINVSGRLVFRGCATPGEVDITDSEGNVVGTKISYTTIGCAPTGTAPDIQLIAPYINIAVGGIKTTAIHTTDDTGIHLGDIGA